MTRARDRVKQGWRAGALAHSARYLQRVREQRRQTSKFLSFVLRHEPEAIGIELDERGWVEIDVLLARANAHGRSISRAHLEEVVATNDKHRFEIDPSGARIRASQGHSVEVDLGYEPVEPPELLYHGTPAASVASIRAEGIDKRSRHDVHLSADVDTAKKVGTRRGEAVVLVVRAGAMHRAGHVFHRSTNGVWLTERVPPEFIESEVEAGRR
jgi:putative RNA 2'-phosphotransferase